MPVIEVYYDPFGNMGGKRGCWRARLKQNHGIHDAGMSEDDAVARFLRLAPSLAAYAPAGVTLTGERSDYEIVVMNQGGA